MSPFRPFALVALLAVAVAGCGGDPKESAKLDQARSTVLRFAAAHDASACKLLTGHALKTVYGGFNSPIPKARATCLKTATGFKGEQVKITKSEILDDGTAKVNALAADSKFTYSVHLTRRPGKPWRIDEINQSRVVE